MAGMDDLRVAEFVGLTTVSLPLYEMGSLAARHIIDTAARAGAPQHEGTGVTDVPATTVLSHRLVARETTTRRADA
ncbi:LacI family transcriptional regulator [Streptomyces alboflavus]|uniref:LacI family transcriptional regulator n=1 Tax=Streptomyces alboflavus TaxID=67267 RepID=A0A1Z1WRP1_9ACTN|nr:LacI family transcriptional regulator [Streptomyces alboflavus]